MFLLGLPFVLDPTILMRGKEFDMYHCAISNPRYIPHDVPNFPYSCTFLGVPIPCASPVMSLKSTLRCAGQSLPCCLHPSGATKEYFISSIIAVPCSQLRVKNNMNSRTLPLGSNNLPIRPLVLLIISHSLN